MIGREQKGPVVTALISAAGRGRGTFQHLGRGQIQPAVIHRFEDRVGVIIRIGGDLHEDDVVFQPIEKVGECLAFDFLRKRFPDIGVTLRHVHGRFIIVRLHIVAAP